MATWKIGPALAAGNTVVLKPSELTPLTALRLAELTADILPPGVLNVVTGEGETAGAALVAHPDVAMVSLTGEVATGKADRPGGGRLPEARPPRAGRQGTGDRVRRRRPRGGRRQAAPRPATTTPVRTARRPAVSSPDPASTTTSSPAHRRRVADAPVGDPPTRTATGPVVSDEQRDPCGLRRSAREAGAEVVTGRRRRSAPGSSTSRVVVGAAQDSEIVQREVFGPVVTVQRVADDEAGHRVGERRRLRPGRERVDVTSVGRCAGRSLQFGTVWINDHIPIVSEMPHGGFKQSGYGKDMSIYAIEHYTEIKHVMVKLRRASGGEGPPSGPSEGRWGPGITRAQEIERDRGVSSTGRAGPRRCTSGPSRPCRRAWRRRSRPATRTRSTRREGHGSHVWDVDDNEYIDYHEGFGTCRRARAPEDRGSDRRAPGGTHFAVTDRGDGRVRRGAVPPLPARQGAVRELRDRGDDERDPFARAATGRDDIVKIEARTTVTTTR